MQRRGINVWRRLHTGAWREAGRERVQGCRTAGMLGGMPRANGRPQIQPPVALCTKRDQPEMRETPIVSLAPWTSIRIPFLCIHIDWRIVTNSRDSTRVAADADCGKSPVSRLAQRTAPGRVQEQRHAPLSRGSTLFLASSIDNESWHRGWPHHPVGCQDCLAVWAQV